MNLDIATILRRKTHSQCVFFNDSILVASAEKKSVLVRGGSQVEARKEEGRAWEGGEKERRRGEGERRKDHHYSIDHR